MDLLSLVAARYDLFFLVFLRIAGVFVGAPVIGSRYLAPQAKVALALAVALLVLPAASEPPGGLPASLLPYLLIGLKEIAVGLVIGWAAHLVFSAVQVAGQMLDMEMGFGMVNVIDPQFGIQLPLIGNFQYILAIMIFLATNGHHFLLAALVDSARSLPVGAALLGNLPGAMVAMVAAMFVNAIKLAAPVLGTLFLTNVCLGLLARAVPQLNVFVIGLPLKLAVGAAALVVAMPLYVIMVGHLFSRLYAELSGLLELLVP
ncbi:MAG: flagellar biosynthetic protein FliR [Bacillota bacterium]